MVQLGTGILFQEELSKVLLNDTAELKEGVDDLEMAMTVGQNDVDVLETDVSLIDGRLLNLDIGLALISGDLISVRTKYSAK